MLTFLRKTFGNGYKIAIGNKICIGILILVCIVSITSVWESCGYTKIESAKVSVYTKLKADLAQHVEQNSQDAEFNNLKVEIQTLEAKLTEAEKKYLPYRTKLTNKRKGEVAAAKAKVAKAQATARTQQELAEKFKLQFSAWNGSHNKTVRYVKARMHNPKSFKHVETKYMDYAEKNYRIILMQYRGTNLFNAVVTNSISVKVDLDGNVIEVISTQ